MFAILFNTLLVTVLLVIVTVFIRGAWRHTIKATFDPGDGAGLTVTTPERYWLLARKILWHLTVPLIKVSGLGLYFIALISDDKNSEIETKTDCYGNKWYRTSSGSWHTKSADPNAVRPHY